MAILSNAQIPASYPKGPSPDWCPPGFIYKDADEIYIPKGRYYKAGYRLNSQYQDLSNIAEYWDVSAQFAVDIDAAYSAGSTSGMVGGNQASTWYSVFMVDSDEIMVLPFIRVDTISYSSPSTTISPAAHADGTTAQNGLVSSSDVFNGYRMLLLVDDATKNGATFTISDCAGGTPDTILITGDVTATIAATNWLQMIPPDGVKCCYLGCVLLDSGGNLKKFRRVKWRFVHVPFTYMAATGATSPRNDDIGQLIPPTARTASIGVQVNDNAGGANAYFYDGSSGTDIMYYPIYNHFSGSNYASMLQVGVAYELILTAKTVLRNQIRSLVTGGYSASGTCYILCFGFEE